MNMNALGLNSPGMGLNLGMSPNYRPAQGSGQPQGNMAHQVSQQGPSPSPANAQQNQHNPLASPQNMASSYGKPQGPTGNVNPNQAMQQQAMLMQGPMGAQVAMGPMGGMPPMHLVSPGNPGVQMIGSNNNVTRRSAAIRIARPDKPDEVVDVNTLASASKSNLVTPIAATPKEGNETTVDSESTQSPSPQLEKSNNVVSEAAELARMQLQNNATRKVIPIRHPNDSPLMTPTGDGSPSLSSIKNGDIPALENKPTGDSEKRGRSKSRTGEDTVTEAQPRRSRSSKRSVSGNTKEKTKSVSPVKQVSIVAEERKVAEGVSKPRSPVPAAKKAQSPSGAAGSRATSPTISLDKSTPASSHPVAPSRASRSKSPAKDIKNASPAAEPISPLKAVVVDHESTDDRSREETLVLSGPGSDIDEDPTLENSDLEDGEILVDSEHVSDAEMEHSEEAEPKRLVINGLDSKGKYRYSLSQLRLLGREKITLPLTADLHVFADFKSQKVGGYSAGSSRGGSSRGGVSRLSHAGGSANAGSGAGYGSTPQKRLSIGRPDDLRAASQATPGNAARSNSSRGDARRDNRSERGRVRPPEKQDSSRGGKRGSERTSGTSTPLPSHVQGAKGAPLLPEDFKPLKHSESRWVPETIATKLGQPVDTAPEESEESIYVAKVEKRFRGLLNKLTPENLEKLQPQFVEPLMCASALKAVTSLIVRKSFDEPKYASLYAKLTLYMCKFMIPFREMGETEESFRLIRAATRKMVIHACQKQFTERPKWSHMSTGKISEEEFEEVVKIKTKALGNIRFVAELFNFGVISNKVMDMIARELLVTNTEEDLECVLMLLTTAGSSMNVQFGRKGIDEYFNLIRRSLEDENMLPRVRFSLIDLIALKENGWVKPKGPQPLPSLQNAAGGAGSARGGSRRGDARSTPGGSSLHGRSGTPTSAAGWSSTSGSRRDPRNFAKQLSGDVRAEGGISPRDGSSLSGRGGVRGGERVSKIATTPAMSNTFAALSSLGDQDGDDSRGTSGRKGPTSASTKTSPVAAMTSEEARAKGELAIKLLNDSGEPSEFLIEMSRVPSDLRNVAFDRALELAFDKKEKEAQLFGKALVLMLKEEVISSKWLMDTMMKSPLIEEYDDAKLDNPILDKLMRVVLKELENQVDVHDLKNLEEKLRF
jgi:hypothetical protein